MNDEPGTVRSPPITHRRRRSSKPKHRPLDLLLSGRNLLLMVSALATLFLLIKMQEFKGLSYYADVLPRQPTSEVLYARGKPSAVRNLPSGGTEWIYQSPPVRVTFDRGGSVVSVSCSGGGGGEGSPCPPALGIGIGTDEFALISSLGAPTHVRTLEGAKIFDYRDVGLSFRLEQFRVRAIQVRRRGDRLSYVQRFLTWVIPPAT